jgi:hypothetical protein
MNMWVIGGVSLTRKQIEDAVARKMEHIKSMLKLYPQLMGSLRFDFLANRWYLVVATEPTRESCIVIVSGDSELMLVEWLIKILEANERRRNRKAGYVIGNRHNYLFELCQAFKEAGRTKWQAMVEIVTWAHNHHDEESRDYIVDMVYGEPLREEAMHNRLTQVAEAEAEQRGFVSATKIASAQAKRVREAVVDHVWMGQTCPPHHALPCYMKQRNFTFCKECWRKWLKSL